MSTIHWIILAQPPYRLNFEEIEPNKGTGIPMTIKMLMITMEQNLRNLRLRQMVLGTKLVVGALPNRFRSACNHSQP